MKILLIPLISLMISNINLTSNRMISNSNYPVESSLVISGKNGENIEGKYKIEQIGNNKFKTTITESGDFVIEGTSKDEVAEEIVVGPNFDGSITIKDLKLFYNYSSSMKSPIDIDASSNVNLIIDGDNSIRAPQYYPAIGFYGENHSGTLTLSSINDGYLYALGGGSDAAAIGGASGVFGESTNSGNIIINSGNYYIDSMGSAGPAIGSGSDNGHIGKIEINGGTIEAISEGNATIGAAIGSGAKSRVDEIVINGGEIKASALNSFSKNAQGAAIGAGSYGEVGNIIINGGNITTITDKGVGIGGSLNYSSSKVIDKIEINGGTIKTIHNDSNIINTIGVSDESLNKVDKIIVNGGSIDTKHFSTSVIDKNSNELVLLTIDDIEGLKGVEIDEKDYNINSLNEDHTLYLYVTKEDHKVVIKKDNENVIYSAKFDGNTNSFDVKNESDNPTIPWEEINPIPVIEANDIELKVNSEFNEEIAKTYAKAFDDEGELTEDIKITYYDVDTSTIGNYKITFEVIDSKGAKANKTIKVIVYDDFTLLNNLPKINGENITIQVGDEFNENIAKKGITATDIEDEDLTNKVEVVEYDVNNQVEGIYHVKFKVEDNDGGISYLTIEVKVIAKATNNFPTINANDITLKLNDEFNEKIALNGVTAYDTEDKDLTKYVRVIDDNVNTSVVGTYSLTYEVKDFDNNVTRKTINVFVINNDEKDPSNDILINTIIISCTSIIIVVIIGLALYFFFKKGK